MDIQSEDPISGLIVVVHCSIKDCTCVCVPQSESGTYLDSVCIAKYGKVKYNREPNAFNVSKY